MYFFLCCCSRTKDRLSQLQTSAPLTDAPIPEEQAIPTCGCSRCKYRTDTWGNWSDSWQLPTAWLCSRALQSRNELQIFILIPGVGIYTLAHISFYLCSVLPEKGRENLITYTNWESSYSLEEQELLKIVLRATDRHNNLKFLTENKKKIKSLSGLIYKTVMQSPKETDESNFNSDLLSYSAFSSTVLVNLL